MRLRANTKKRRAAHVWASEKPTREAAADVVSRLGKRPLRPGEVSISVQDLASSQLNSLSMGVEYAAVVQSHIMQATDELQLRAAFGRRRPL